MKDNSIRKSNKEMNKDENSKKAYKKLFTKIKLAILVGIACFLLAVLTGCDRKSNISSSLEDKSGEDIEEFEASKDIFAMDTYMKVTVYAESQENADSAVDSAIEEIERLDGVLSTGDDSSEISVINKTGKGAMSEDVNYLISRAVEMYASTQGKFDIAIYPVMKAWGFADKNYRVPEQSELDELLRYTDLSEIKYDSEKKEIQLPSGMEIDLGGIAKGYTSYKVISLLKEMGIKHALINLGGNVQVLGSKCDGSNWKVGIQDPDDESAYFGIISVKDKAVITSGAYERYFEQDGKVYHHIIDPSTGYPSDSDLKSVTIISEDGTMADALSTSLFIMGKDKAEEYYRNHKGEFEAVLMDSEGNIYVTAGIIEDFTSDLEYTVIGN